MAQTRWERHQPFGRRPLAGVSRLEIECIQLCYTICVEGAEDLSSSRLASRLPRGKPKEVPKSRARLEERSTDRSLRFVDERTERTPIKPKLNQKNLKQCCKLAKCSFIA